MDDRHTTEPEPARRWLGMLDMHGAGSLAPRNCRENLLQADALLSPFSPDPVHFAEFPLVGDPSFDMSWLIPATCMEGVQNPPAELEGAKHLAHELDEGAAFGVEYDTSSPNLPRAGFYFKGLLKNGNHPMRKMMEYVGRHDEAQGAVLLVARLVALGYRSLMCGVMAGRSDAPIRITAQPQGRFDALRLMKNLIALGFERLPKEAFRQLDQVCAPNKYMFAAPLVHLDVMPGGTLGPTLGIELGGIRTRNIDDYPQLQLAQKWGLADDRWHTLRDACFHEEKDGCNLFFAVNTLKFRWRGGSPLPTKLYLKAGW